MTVGSSSSCQLLLRARVSPSCQLATASIAAARAPTSVHFEARESTASTAAVCFCIGASADVTAMSALACKGPFDISTAVASDINSRAPTLTPADSLCVGPLMAWCTHEGTEVPAVLAMSISSETACTIATRNARPASATGPTSPRPSAAAVSSGSDGSCATERGRIIAPASAAPPYPPTHPSTTSRRPRFGLSKAAAIAQSAPEARSDGGAGLLAPPESRAIARHAQTSSREGILACAASFSLRPFGGARSPASTVVSADTTALRAWASRCHCASVSSKFRTPPPS
mmetsp:Transcript_10985/g.45540  ORF Transcript_10985/g.45540 Transcript_10985/m.45540 type:complete len:287 (-) Transcript_10985:4172-5032(-)